jgi:hypothetical protein
LCFIARLRAGIFSLLRCHALECGGGDSGVPVSPVQTHWRVSAWSALLEGRRHDKEPQCGCNYTPQCSEARSTFDEVLALHVSTINRSSALTSLLMTGPCGRKGKVCSASSINQVGRGRGIRHGRSIDLATRSVARCVSWWTRGKSKANDRSIDPNRPLWWLWRTADQRQEALSSKKKKDRPTYHTKQPRRSPSLRGRRDEEEASRRGP